jgi:selenocysteine lyase/cysteine desulfurase
MSDDGTAGPASAWRRRPGYLDTATYGLPPIATVERGHQVLEEWADGDVHWQTWNEAADEARRAFAALVGVDAASVAVGPATSTLAGLVASSLPAGAEVVVHERDFTALLFPFLVRGQGGVTVRAVALEALADSVRPSTSVVAFSAVQSSDGRVADVEAVLEAAGRAGALTVVDATQAIPWLPLPVERFDAVLCSAYKWLCCPRGAAFMVVSPRLLSRCTPTGASWYAAPEPYRSFYGLPLRLADSARRLDLSPAWFAWTGAVTSLAVLAAIGVEAMHAHDVRLANCLRERLDLPSAGSAIVSVATAEQGGAEQGGVEQALAAAGIKAAVRADGCRLSFHIYNDDDDVEAAVAALRRLRPA